MYNAYRPYSYPYCYNTPMYNPAAMYGPFKTCPYPHCITAPVYGPDLFKQLPGEHVPLPTGAGYCAPMELKDYGPEPFVINIEEAARQNSNFRTVLWTGKHLQLALMSLNVGEDIGLEMHPAVDQFIRIEEGRGIVKMGNSRDNLDFERRVFDGYVIFIPAGKWHNLINTGHRPLKLYTIYAPPEHPKGTVHVTKEEAQAAERKRLR